MLSYQKTHQNMYHINATFLLIHEPSYLELGFEVQNEELVYQKHTSTGNGSVASEIISEKELIGLIKDVVMKNKFYKANITAEKVLHGFRVIKNIKPVKVGGWNLVPRNIWFKYSEWYVI